MFTIIGAADVFPDSENVHCQVNCGTKILTLGQALNRGQGGSEAAVVAAPGSRRVVAEGVDRKDGSLAALQAPGTWDLVRGSDIISFLN